jgi:hypothetical protein
VIAIDNTLISTEIFEKKFVCDLAACKGACCVEGESGAPLEDEELEKLYEVIDEVLPYLRPESREILENGELFEIDSDGDHVTPIFNGKDECVYATFDADGTAKCGIEKAFLDGKTTWRKPISCHMYPIRVTKLKDYDAVNYHHWPICKPACECGSKLDVRVYKFLKEPLIRKYGEEWYAVLEEAFEQWSQSDQGRGR